MVSIHFLVDLNFIFLKVYNLSNSNTRKEQPTKLDLNFKLLKIFNSNATVSLRMSYYDKYLYLVKILVIHLPSKACFDENCR